MKAVVFHDVGDIRLEEVPKPTIVDATDAIVRLTASAICGTDLHMVRGTLSGMAPGTILGPGEFFGEMGLIDDEPRSATVVTIEPCELLSIAKRDFKKSLADNFDMSMAVMRGLVRRLREADRKIGSLALLDVYGRVARLLLDMAENVDGEKVVTKRLPKQDIAKMIGASREMVSRVMKDLQTGGYIEMRGSTIVLRDTIMLPE